MLKQISMYDIPPGVLSIELARALLEPVHSDRRESSFDRYGVAIEQEKSGRLLYPLPKIRSIPLREESPVIERRRIRKWQSTFRFWDRTGITPIAGTWPHLRDRAYKGIPDGIRGETWLRLLGAWDEMRYSETGFSRASVDYAVQHIENSAYGSALHIPVSLSTQSLVGRDVRRTFNGFAVLSSQQGFLSLTRILLAAAGSEPRVGFVQGMTHLAAVFLNTMTETDAFHALISLIRRPDVAPCFVGSMPGVRMKCRILDQLLELYEPRWARMVASSPDMRDVVSPLFWATSSFVTFFFRDFPFPVAARIFDRYLVDGDVVLYRTLVALVRREFSGPLCRTERRFQWTKSRHILPALDSPALETIQNRFTISQRLMTMAQRVTTQNAQGLLDDAENLTEITTNEIHKLQEEWQSSAEGRDLLSQSTELMDEIDREATRLRNDETAYANAQRLVQFLCEDIVFDDCCRLCGAITEQDSRDLVGLGGDTDVLPNCNGDAGLMLALLRAKRCSSSSTPR